ncbi:MAG: DinB family protein [Chitinophagaceae bacterium]|nr:DinB family protein [Chitinophagaceae bacterium]
MKTEIQTKIDNTLTELIQLFSTIDQQQINIVPYEGSWTAAQLAQHMILSNSGFAEMINGPVKETKRNPDELVERIKSDFLDFTTKMKSPDPIVPAMAQYNKEDLLNSSKNIRENVHTAIQTEDLTKTCVMFELPGYGFLTRLEAAHFILYHTQRHIHQLKKIIRKLANVNASLS